MDLTAPLQDANFLPPEATLSQRWLALRLHVQARYLHSSRVSDNPATFRTSDILCTTSQCMLPSEESAANDDVLESLITWYRTHRESGAIIWFLHPERPRYLDARLYARGVCPNWEPHWMWCELQGMKQVGKLGDGIRIRVEGEKDDSAISHPVGEKRVWNVSALRGEGWLGGCTLQVTTGEHGVGGLFDMYVKPEEQRQGIGTALTQATCELAMKLGCHHVVLNATEEGGPVYQRVGFQSLGMGRTWFLRDSVFDLPPPSPGQVRFLEAVGKGDISALDAMKDGLLPEQLSGETINGETPLEIAVRCKQKGSVEWLVEHGVVPDIMSLWDLGWKDRIPALLATHPELVRRKSGRWTATPLHYAIERNDVDMAKLLLSVPNDLECKDGVFQCTPLEWAERSRQTEFIALLSL